MTQIIHVQLKCPAQSEYKGKLEWITVTYYVTSMRRQKNMAQVKEQNKSPEKNMTKK